MPLQPEALHTEEPRAFSLPRLILIFSLLAVANLYSVFQRSDLAVVSNDLMAEFSLTPSQLGALNSCFLYSYAAMQILSGLLTGRLGVRLLIVGSVFSAAVCSCFFVSLESTAGLMFFRVLIGIACSFIYIPALNEIRRLFPPEWVTVLIGMYLSAGHVGSVLAASPLKAMCDWLGWKGAFLWLTGIIPFFVAALLFLLLPKAPKRDKTAAPPKPLRETLREMKQSFHYMVYPAVLVVILWSIFSGSPRHTFSSVWVAQFYENAAGCTPGEMSDAALCLSIGCILGGPVCGRIANRLGVMKTLIASTVTAGIVWMLLVPAELAVDSQALRVALMLLVGIAGTGGFTCAFASVKYLDLSPQAVGLFTAFVNSMNFFASAIVSQIIGIVVERYAQVAPLTLYGVIFACFCLMSIGIAVALGIVHRKNIGH